MPSNRLYFTWIIFTSFLFSLTQTDDSILDISMGILHTRTVVVCGFSMHIHPTFETSQILLCPYVSIVKDQFELIDINITMASDETIDVQLSSQSMMQPKLVLKMSNDSSNDSITYYLSFTPELTCRYSSVSNKLVCFYHLSTSNLTQLENEYDRFNDRKQQSSARTQYYLKIFYTIIVILTVCTCILALYLLCCTEKLAGEHRIRLDYIVDPQLAREAALKLGPEPV